MVWFCRFWLIRARSSSQPSHKEKSWRRIRARTRCSWKPRTAALSLSARIEDLPAGAKVDNPYVSGKKKADESVEELGPLPEAGDGEAVAEEESGSRSGQRKARADLLVGKFAELDDVTTRYEGDFPAEREDWVELRITDVEADLVLMVPSLDEPVDQISPARLQRVKALVADKVLELFRNPERVTQHTTTFGPLSEALSYARTSPMGYFTEDEVRNIRLRTKRSNLGTAHVKPFNPHAGRRWCSGEVHHPAQEVHRFDRRGRLPDSAMIRSGCATKSIRLVSIVEPVEHDRRLRPAGHHIEGAAST
jgi:hypothetical protein